MEHLKCVSLANSKLERLTKDKHSRLLRTFMNYGRKKFCNIIPTSRLQSVTLGFYVIWCKYKNISLIQWLLG
jgi:hypothetical protein